MFVVLSIKLLHYCLSACDCNTSAVRDISLCVNFYFNTTSTVPAIEYRRL